MKILFTPIGGSDPIMSGFDGPMLHCLRIYKPDLVYVYYTNAMIEKEDEIDWTVKKLGESLNIEFELKSIKRPDMIAVQKFDAFYDEFDEITSEIYKQYPDAELYFNVSSGTPAMKNSLVLIGSLARKKINLIQVSSGMKGPNHTRHETDNCTKEVKWECNEDNEGECTDRTELIENTELLIKLKKSYIINALENYDYYKALEFANEINVRIDDCTKKFIKAAFERYRLDYNAMVQTLKGTNYTPVPVTKTDEREIVEYILWLDLMCNKKEYLTFIRGITPIAMSLMKLTVKKYTKIGDIDSEKYSITSYGKTKLSRERMSKTDIGQEMISCLDSKFGEFKDSVYTTAHLQTLISNMCDNKKLIELTGKIRKAEEELRNQAAHVMMALDENFIQRRINMSARELSNIIQELAKLLGVLKKEYLSSYDEMNKVIIDRLTN